LLIHSLLEKIPVAFVRPVLFFAQENACVNSPAVRVGAGSRANRTKPVAPAVWVERLIESGLYPVRKLS
jgi:hypothetical protein